MKKNDFLEIFGSILTMSLMIYAYIFLAILGGE